MNNKKNLLPYRGTKDYYPADYKRLDYIFSVWREACEAFGYEEYLAPLVEHRSLYTQKQASGDEISNKQLYWLVDRSGREIAIRPEMTPSVSRMIGAKIDSLPKPVRWFSIANFMRYERPQKGRVREFFQLNIDCFGVESNKVDAELIELAIYIMKLFGADSSMYEIRLNNRKWLDYYMRKILNINKNIQSISRILDNMEKVSIEESVKQLEKLELGPSQIDSLINLRDQNINDVRKHVKDSGGASELVELLDLVSSRGYGDYIKYDGALVRGFDYYTGNVFEQFDKHERNPRSMFGGGRYDDLVRLYSGKDVPACGLAPGNLTTQLFLDNWELWPELEVAADALVTVFSEAEESDSWRVANKLREVGLNVELYIGDKRMASQLDYANKRGIPIVVIIGPEEVEKGTLIWKNMRSGKQQEVDEEKLFDGLIADIDQHDD